MQATGGNIGVIGDGVVTGGVFTGYGTGTTYGVQAYGNEYGVYAAADEPDGVGVYGWSNKPGGIGVYGAEYIEADYAAYFAGDVQVTGTLSKGAGSFKIDHPLDPANKYLSHSFVESPDMMNVYNGNVVTDEAGEAKVILPEWFEVLNRDFRYQLTVIGQFAQAIVASEVTDNSFAIKTDKGNVKVSWQVTGIRKDPYAERHRIPVEHEKPAAERGKYLHPELYGHPVESSVHYRDPAASRSREKPAEAPGGAE